MLTDELDNDLKSRKNLGSLSYKIFGAIKNDHLIIFTYIFLNFEIIIPLPNTAGIFLIFSLISTKPRL